MVDRSRRKQTSKWDRKSAFRAQSAVKESCYSGCACGTRLAGLQPRYYAGDRCHHVTMMNTNLEILSSC